MSSETSKEEYFFSFYGNLFSYIQLQARVCKVEGMEVKRDYLGPSLLVNYSYNHVMTLNKWENAQVEINLDKRTWGEEQVTEANAEKFVIHFDNLCYSLEQVQRG